MHCVCDHSSPQQAGRFELLLLHQPGSAKTKLKSEKLVPLHEVAYPEGKRSCFDRYGSVAQYDNVHEIQITKNFDEYIENEGTAESHS